MQATTHALVLTLTAAYTAAAPIIMATVLRRSSSGSSTSGRSSGALALPVKLTSGRACDVEDESLMNKHLAGALRSILYYALCSTVSAHGSYTTRCAAANTYAGGIAFNSTGSSGAGSSRSEYDPCSSGGSLGSVGEALGRGIGEAGGGLQVVWQGVFVHDAAHTCPQTNKINLDEIRLD